DLMKMIEEEPGVDGVTVANGFSFMTGAAASNGASLFIKLHDWETRNSLGGEHSANAIAARINGRAAMELPQAVVFAMGPPA
ncbi:efflux RND transporter permease subunit, partial [Escherichia coli]|nr:efflux RND transporter permease subunit [Escherichia coli]